MSVIRFEMGQAIGLRRLCRLTGTRPAWIAELVAHGVIEVRGERPTRWRFDEAALGRSLRARRLAADLGLNAAGVAVAMELADRLRRTRRELDALRRQSPVVGAVRVNSSPPQRQQ
ncbi:MAG: chaperone modulator CbpM [Pseudomonadales bacterium]|nr:chaperone modulator CbpM [Pseudomonadales bacterium]